jgi:transcriptional regulator with XRE-family HTH domain
MDTTTKPTTAAVIGPLVKSCREAAGKTRREFALTVQIPNTSYRDRELGRLDFTIPQLERISAALDVDLAHWFRDIPKPLAA